MRKFRKLNFFKKRTLLVSLGFLYLGTIVSFGLVYWKIANMSAGQFFVFHNDININTKVSVFKKEMGIHSYSRELYNTISDLMSSEECKRPLIKILNSEENKLHFFSFDNSLGKLWANYYYIITKEKGITHFKITNVQEELLNGKFKTYKLTLDLYNLSNLKGTESKYELYKKKEVAKTKAIDKCTIWIKEYPEVNEELFSTYYEYYPISFYFTKLMENSISFLDNSPVVLDNVAKGNFKYPLWNFLYFSAVTITTLGYGDILPNSTLVRTLVMFETIFGVVIIGMFISCLFWSKSE